MSKKIAVIASILKPVNDTRLYEKLGRSIRESNKYRVHIIGFGVKKLPHHVGISFHTMYQGARLSLARLLAPWKFLLFLIKLGPELTIVCTPELLLPATLYKIVFGTKLWYDVQENYLRNIQYQSVYPTLLKPFLISIVWLTEFTTSPFVNLYILAEKGYSAELTFIKGKFMVLENKYHPLRIPPKAKANDKLQLAFTGTVSRQNGVLEAISLVKELHSNKYPVQLSIVGQVTDEDLLQHINQQINCHGELIQLIGGADLVPHQDIMQSAALADFGLIAHQPNPSTQNCIPTKIYEYLGLGLPILLQSHALWESVIAPYHAGVVLDYNNFHPKLIWEQINTGGFYTTTPGPEITWKQESVKLQRELEMISEKL